MLITALKFSESASLIKLHPQEGLNCFEKLESGVVMVPSSGEDWKKKMNRSAVTLSAVAKIVQLISDSYRNSVRRELEIFVQFVSRLLAKGGNILPQLAHRALVDRLNRDIYTPAFLHHITTRHL
jgi:hypothetical protein